MKNNKADIIKAMVSLLDNPNEKVFVQIDKDIREIGGNHIATMKKLFAENNNDLRKERLKIN